MAWRRCSIPSIAYPSNALQLPQERPGIGMIGVDPKGRGQFRRAFIWLAVINQHVAENCMGYGIFRVKRYSVLRCRQSQRTMAPRRAQPIRPPEMVAHREPSVSIGEVRVKFDGSFQKRGSGPVAFG